MPEQDEVWVLGAAGRSGRAVAEALSKRGVPIAVVGRDRTRLEQVAVGSARVVVVDSVRDAANRVATQRPAVVVNTIGPFGTTAPLIAQACLPASHYVDISNDLTGARAVTHLHAQAVAAKRSFLTGAAFGVVATESVVVLLCAGRERPVRVRVDAMASLDLEAGRVGAALAGSILDGVALGSRHYVEGQSVRARSSAYTVRLPDGREVRTGEVPTAELHAAWLASRAPTVVATSALAPSSPIARAVLPAVSALTALGPLRRLMTTALARAPLSPAAREHAHSWGHAEVTWGDGRTRAAFLRLGDAGVFTADMAVETTVRLLRGTVPAGASTPATALGTELAETAGGHYLHEPEGQPETPRTVV